MNKVINRLINDATQGVDTYKTKDSTWLIFTESKRWVIELTKGGTLWYNYNFFQGILVYLSMDVIENQHYITKWVEDNVITGVKRINEDYSENIEFVEHTIQNGVKDTYSNYGIGIFSADKEIVEHTIQNGVKDIRVSTYQNTFAVEHIIQNGVKDTEVENFDFIKSVEDTIQNGVKHTEYGDWLDGDERFDDIIQNGVKKTLSVEEGTFTSIGFGAHVEDTLQNGVKYVGGIGNPKWVGKKVEDTIQNGVKETKIGAPDNRDYFIEDAIQNGVKHTEAGGYLGSIEMKGKIVHQLESPKQNEEVEYVIENGVKRTVCSSAPFVYTVKDTLQHGVKETFDETHHRRREVVRTIRDGIKETYDDAYHHKSRVDGVIKNGIKQTCAQIPSIQPVVERILEEGIIQDSQDC
jgi:predicted peroxiredoxin